MGTYLRPGVFIEEKPSGPAPIQGVATATLGAAGWTDIGEEHTAFLVTSWIQFVEKFGGFTESSKMPTAVFYFFQNGGQRAYIVRTTPSDAVNAVSYITDTVTAETIETGNGVLTAFSGTLAGIPEPGTLTISTPLPVVFTDSDMNGTLTGVPSGSGTIDYDTGEYTLTFAVAPLNAVVVSATYSKVLFQLDLKWPGLNGNNYRVRIEGNPNSEVTGEGTFTAWDVMVDKLDTDTNVWSEIERFPSLSLTDPTSADYIASKLNELNVGSDIFSVETPSGDDAAPRVLSGTAVTSEAVGTGNGTQKAFTDTLVGGACVKFSILIEGVNPVQEVTDDGRGNLIGDIDASGVNTINYETGAFTVTFATAPVNATAVTVDYYDRPASTSYTDQATGGLDGSAVSSSDVTAAGLAADKKGIYAFNEVSDILLMILPDFVGITAVDAALADFVDSKVDRFAILAPPEGYSPSEAKDHKVATLAKISSRCAMYWPWVLITDPVTELVAAFPPVGHVAGIYARTDTTRNVGKAPAGRDDGQLLGVLGLEYEANDSELEVIYPVGVNPLLRRPPIGTAVFGARTLDAVGEYNYIQARRLQQFLAKSIFNSTHWINFENNGPELWVRVKFQLESFFRRLFDARYFAGVKPSDAYFIQVDEQNNPPESVAAGVLLIDIAFAPNKPAEFVVFRFQQKTAG